MSVTPNFSWPLIEPTDFVTNLPADFEVFADAVDADLAGLLGGTTGQVLTKDSNADHDFSWQTAAGGSDPVLPRIESGYYVSVLRSGAPGTGAATNNTTYYTPIYLKNCTLDRIGFRAINHSVTGNVRLGIYANGTNNLPSTLILDAGTTSVTTNAIIEVTINQAITAGWYWLAINKNSGTFNMYTTGTNTYYPMNTPGTNTMDLAITGTLNNAGYSQSGVTGAFGNATNLTIESSPWIAAVRVA